MRRVVKAAIVMVGVSSIVFGMVHLVPGDPIRVALGTRFDPDRYETPAPAGRGRPAAARRELSPEVVEQSTRVTG